MEELWETMTHPPGEMSEAEFEVLSDDERHRELLEQVREQTP